MTLFILPFLLHFHFSDSGIEIKIILSSSERNPDDGETRSGVFGAGRTPGSHMTSSLVLITPIHACWFYLSKSCDRYFLISVQVFFFPNRFLNRKSLSFKLSTRLFLVSPLFLFLFVSRFFGDWLLPRIFGIGFIGFIGSREDFILFTLC